jgi:NAD(P)-dependent dehydrogenase (short-subunit alcohol dehydrogenase family)
VAIADVSGKTVHELISLDGRVAVVTGEARGIGFAICKRFAEVGAQVLVADLSEDAAKTAAGRICAQGG